MAAHSDDPGKNDPGKNDPGEAGTVTGAAIATLAVLVAVNILSSLDRFVPSILAQSIKADLRLTDAQLGFILGTGFAVFYAIFGIAMGRIADGVNRPRLLAVGLALWSLTTAAGGLAVNFAILSLARIAVGVGESTVNPSAQSLVADRFPARTRSLALGIYLFGAFAGSALALIAGGLFVQHWPALCGAVPFGGACRLHGWQAALIGVGLPGLPFALLVLCLRDPRGPQSGDRPVARLLLREFSASITGLNMLTLYRVGGAGPLRANLLLALCLVAGVAALDHVLGDGLQWAAVALGTHAIVTWGTIQKYRDRAFHDCTFGRRTFLLTTIAGALVGCVAGGPAVWGAPFAIRVLHVSVATAGVTLGVTNAAISAFGVVTGGWITDRWRRHNVRAPLWMALACLLVTVPAMLVMVRAGNWHGFLAGFTVFAFAAAAWSGGMAALIQGLVPARFRGSAVAAYGLVNFTVSSGLGPYWIGKVSTLSGSLGLGLMSLEALAPVAAVLLVVIARRLGAELSTPPSPTGMRR